MALRMGTSGFCSAERHSRASFEVNTKGKMRAGVGIEGPSKNHVLVTNGATDGTRHSIDNSPRRMACPHSADD
eukprot:3803088-Amphidinium_carterae.2